MTTLSVRDLHVPVGMGRATFMAVDGVELEVPPGQVVGLVGESGSGKSTLARAIVGLAPAARGQILLGGHDYRGARGRRLRELRRRVQMVFQDPRASLNPRMTVGEALGEVVQARAGDRVARPARRAEVVRLLRLVTLDAAYANARPGALSGGERQRVAIARALAVRPDVLVADEVTSALDASIQAAVLNLLREVRQQTGLSMLFISHNLAVVRYVSDAIAVMQLGRIVERGPAHTLLARPRHPYTRLLIDSIAPDDIEPRADAVADPPDPLHPPSGCRFHRMCPVGPLVDPSRQICLAEDPGAVARSREQSAACHFAPLREPVNAR
jgi:peptide/nickel transport system ATP-binding protein